MSESRVIKVGGEPADHTLLAKQGSLGVYRRESANGKRGFIVARIPRERTWSRIPPSSVLREFGSVEEAEDVLRTLSSRKRESKGPESVQALFEFSP
jgi:hypothetical protein